MRLQRRPRTARRSATSVGVALTMLLVGTLIGSTTQHLASASLSSGERTVLVPIEPCRLADTRGAPNTVGPRSVAIGAADTHTVAAQQSGTPCSGKIPVDASALSLNVTALGATQLSFLTIWADGPRPDAASLNPAPGQPPVPNAVTTKLSASQQFQIYNNAGSVNVVIDVNGYYVDHDHDDRYYTEAESDARFLTEATGDARYAPIRRDEVFVRAVDLRPEGPGWYVNSAFVRHDSNDYECVAAGLDLAAGSSVESVELRYSAATPVTLDILIGGSSREAVDFSVLTALIDVLLIDSVRSLPASPTDRVSIATILSDPPDLTPGLTLKDVSSDRDNWIEFCTDEEILILGASITLS